MRAWPAAVCTAMAAWTATLFAIAHADYRSFASARYDLGNMTQAVWSTVHGRPLEVTSATGEQLTRLGAHVDPILVLFAPAWLVWPSPLLLAFTQIAACTSGALPVFWLARKHLASERLGGLIALAYLAYPWLAWNALDSIHPVTFAIPLFLYAIWFLDEGKLWAFVVCAALVLMTGELMGVTLAGLGIWHWLAHRRRREGIVIAVAGLAWSAIAVQVVLPHYRGEESPFFDYYERVGGSPEGVIQTLFTDPGTIASVLLSPTNAGYLLLLAFPLAGLFVLAPGLAAVAVPGLLAIGLSEGTLATDPRHHYSAAVIPFLVAAAALGVARLGSRGRVAAPIAMLSLSLMTIALVAPLPDVPWSERVLGAAARNDFTYAYVKGRSDSRHVAALEEALENVPGGAPVSATNKAGLRLSARRYAYNVPVLGRARWVLLDTTDPWVLRAEGREGTSDPAALSRFERRLRASGEWSLVFRRDGVLLFERTL
jgi:uncharacterized membrane protein